VIGAILDRDRGVIYFLRCRGSFAGPDFEQIYSRHNKHQHR